MCVKYMKEIYKAKFAFYYSWQSKPKQRTISRRLNHYSITFFGDNLNKEFMSWRNRVFSNCEKYNQKWTKIKIDIYKQ